MKKILWAIIVLVACGYFFTHTNIGRNMLESIGAMKTIEVQDVDNAYNKGKEVIGNIANKGAEIYTKGKEIYEKNKK